uniref:Uncharacterized protein n=1 Tax=Monopterus albus TaxID=43700 RepID=A0A3Q3Q4M0_MONAL
SGGSSGSLEQSLPAAGTKSCNSSKWLSALDARSLASWNSSLRDRLKFKPYYSLYLISSEAVLSSALSQNSLPLFCRPASRNSPVDFSSIPAMSLSTHQKSFPDWASPPRM